MSSVYLKISSLLIRTLSKPIANRIKDQARQHEGFRKICISFAQTLHRFDMRLRLGLLQDQAAIDRQIARAQAEARAAAQKRKHDAIPTVKTEAQSKADELRASLKEKGVEQKKDKEPPPPMPKIRPLSEAKAIDSGANFISEGFLFSVGLGLIIFETWRSRRKEQSRRDEVSDRLDSLENRNRTLEQRVAEYERQYGRSVREQAEKKLNEKEAEEEKKVKQKA